MKDFLDPSTLTHLARLSDEERSLALMRFRIITPFLEGDVPLRRLAQEAGISYRTAGYWVKRYRSDGLLGLARKARHDKNKRRLSATLRELIEGLALQKPRLSVTSIHRKVVDASARLVEARPSYDVVYRIIRSLEPGLVTMAHEG